MEYVSARKVDREYVVVVALVVFGIVCRIAFLDVVSPDGHYFLLPWFEQLRHVGLAALDKGMADVNGEVTGAYSPPYYYLLWLATLLPGFVKPLWLIKFISFAFDLVGAAFAYRIVQLTEPKRAPFAAALVIAAPTAVLNDGWFGQCDMIWVSLLLGSFYFTLTSRPYTAMALFAVAFAFKAQAIFLSPYLFMLFLRRDIRIRHVAIVPFVYLLMMLPAIAAGEPLGDIFLAYVHQGSAYHMLSKHAANPYYLLGDHFYDVGVIVGMILTAGTCFAMALAPVIRRVPLNPPIPHLFVTVFLAIVPFILPKMHDRYFFAADMASIVLALVLPRLWAIPVALQISSASAYVPMMSWTLTGRFVTSTMPMAVLLNCALVAYLFYLFVQTCARQEMVLKAPVKPFILAGLAILIAHAVWLVAATSLMVLQHRCVPDSQAWLCSQTLPSDWVIFGSWRQWCLYALLQVACIPIANRMVIALLSVDWFPKLTCNGSR